MRNPERRTVGSAWAFNVLVMLQMCSLNAGETLCDDGWNDFGGNCYLVREELSIQAGAQDYCKMHGSNLASIHSDGEQEFIHSILYAAHAGLAAFFAFQQRPVSGEMRDMGATWGRKSGSEY
ncbi:hypothetical protein CAPTEDRAFT_214071 [Capitella teleta]|uniref:C-type lectin domain-containing protein n=1 Tax=Capitella teleta TaxID=283909 RepID=R7TKR4_CAPTE|nr:hypothetical protein CAPTEDRAFT_214071 [Capitella teleta]|eukprot:ELT94097.1 hypothetical protein CAPTEDRAFT_214071 [Capitella teleta]